MISPDIVKVMYVIISKLTTRDAQNRVQGGLDDLDILGHLSHFIDESSRSHRQTKISGCM